MRNRAVLIFVFLFSISLSSFSQRTDTLIKKLDSLGMQTDSGKQINNTNPAAYNEATQLNVPDYFILLSSDLKQAFTKPFHMKKRDWGYLGAAVAVTAVATLVDQPVQQFALRLRNANAGLRDVSKFVTDFGGPYEGYTLAAFGAYGFIFNNKKIKTTVLLATQAYVTAAAVEAVMKFVSGRTRPSFYDPGTTAVPRFTGPFSSRKDYTGDKLSSSFPSGHTTVAFAAATVYAMEYKSRPWVPVFAYTAASLIGISRITENKHWTTDVLVGAALGYLSGRLVVNNYHRYAKLKAPKQQKNTVSFSINYSEGVLMPGLVYRF